MWKKIPSFFKKIQEILVSNEQEYIIICGDFNIALNPTLDTYNYTNVNNPSARKTLLQMMATFNLTDVFRHLHDERRYTWRRKNPVRQARLDYFITTL